MKLNVMFYLSVLLLLSFYVYGDTNGVWHIAEDMRPGTFGNDEGAGVGNNFTFINDVYMIKTLNVTTNSGVGVYSYSSGGDGVAGFTSANNRAGIYGFSGNANSYSGYFEGGNFVVMDGNVGIGIKSPNSKLDVNGTLIIRETASCAKLYTDSLGKVSCGTDNVNDADYSTTNEIQAISRIGETISLNKGGGSFSISDKAHIGSCASGQFVTGTSSTGVTCAAPTSSSKVPVYKLAKGCANRVISSGGVFTYSEGTFLSLNPTCVTNICMEDEGDYGGTPVDSYFRCDGTCSYGYDSVTCNNELAGYLSS